MKYNFRLLSVFLFNEQFDIFSYEFFYCALFIKEDQNETKKIYLF